MCSWENNCAANNETNGVDLKVQGLSLDVSSVSPIQRRRAKGVLLDNKRAGAVGLPGEF